MAFRITQVTKLLLRKLLSTDTDAFEQFQDSSKNTKWQVDSTGASSVTGVVKARQCCTQARLTAAQIISMFTTPITIVPAPAALTTAIVVEQITVELDLTATQFTSGGVVHFFYHGLTVELMAQTIPAATVNGGAATTLLVLEPVQTAGGSVVTPGVGVDITNSTGVFATGTGTAVVTVWYSLVDLG